MDVPHAVRHARHARGVEEGRKVEPGADGGGVVLKT